MQCYIHAENLAKLTDAKIADSFKRQFSKLSSDEIRVLSFFHKRLLPMKKAA
jgi:DNA topoisomerase I